jgi:Family of unknown function (DUF6350)
VSLLLSPVSRAEPAGEGTRLSWGALLGVACLPAVLGYLAVAVVFAALTAAAGAGSSMPWLARIAAAGWLAAHHIPLTIDGAPLGVLPLLFTLLLGALVARGAAGAAERFGIHQPTDAGWVAGVIAGVHGIGGAVLALVATPATVIVDPALATVGCAVVAGAAAAVGLAGPCGLLPAALRQAPGWVLPGLLAGMWGLAALLTAGLATVLLAVAVSAPDVLRTLGPDAGSAFGLTVLSIGYLPNAAIGALSWLAGPGFSIGALSVSPFAVHAGPTPAVPLLAALPVGPPQSWWVAALAVPLLAGAAVGRRCAAAGELPERLRVLGVAGTAIALGAAVLALLGGGQLGAAAFDPVDVPAGPLAVALLATTLLGGCAPTLLSAPAKRSPADDDAKPVAAELDDGAGEAGENAGDADGGAVQIDGSLDVDSAGDSGHPSQADRDEHEPGNDHSTQ